MSDGKLTVTALGNFKVTLNDKQLTTSKSKISKSWESFLILLMTNDNHVPNEQLMQYLWNSNPDLNLPNTLKNVIYCLRRDIKDSNTTNNVVLFSQGRYIINPNADIDFDVYRLKELHLAIDIVELSSDQIISICTEIIDLYGTGFVLKSEYFTYAESWVSSINNIYIDTCRRLAIEYVKNKMYIEAENILSTALQVDQANCTISNLLLTVLDKLNKTDEIIDLYHRLGYTSSICPDELSKKVYENACTKTNNQKQDLLMICAEINTHISNSSTVKRSYFCSIDAFKHICDIKQRDVARYNKSVIIAIISIQNDNVETINPNVLNSAMSSLKNVIGSSLRRSDVFAKYSDSQYVLMMIAENTSQVEKSVIPRLINRFTDINKNLTINSVLGTI